MPPFLLALAANLRIQGIIGVGRVCLASVRVGLGLSNDGTSRIYASDSQGAPDWCPSGRGTIVTPRARSSLGGGATCISGRNGLEVPLATVPATVALAGIVTNFSRG